VLARAPEQQFIDMRRAFYAGATALLESIMEHLEPGEDPTDEDLTMMDKLHAGLEAFATAMRECRA
jgi:hypothetical protein